LIKTFFDWWEMSIVQEYSSESDSSEEIQCGQRIQEHVIQINLISGEKEHTESTQDENVEDEDLLMDEGSIIEEINHNGETIQSNKVEMLYNEELSDEEDIVEVVEEELEETSSQEITLAQKTKEETSPPKKKLFKYKYL
jgi:hypothetical protein